MPKDIWIKSIKDKLIVNLGTHLICSDSSLIKVQVSDEGGGNFLSVNFSCSPR